MGGIDGENMGMGRFRAAKGVTLTELMVVLAIASLAIFAISTLLLEAYKDWGTSRQVTGLQSDLDLAAYTMKGVLEEAKSVDIQDPGPPDGRIKAFYKDGGSPKEFYRSGNSLLLRDYRPGGGVEYVIDSLASLAFHQDSTDSDTVVVTLNAQRGARTLQTSFIVHLRNR